MAKFVKASKHASTPAPVAAETEKEITPIPVTPTQASAAPVAKTSSPVSPDVAMVVAESVEMVKEMGGVIAEKAAATDDVEMTTHPTKDYSLSDNAARVGGTRSFQPDLLSRQLCATMYNLEETKDWGPNPLGGAPVPVVYTREFPEIAILYDSFDQVPDPKLLELKRRLAHEHGRRYLYQCPGNTLTPDVLTKQLEAEKPFKK